MEGKKVSTKTLIPFIKGVQGFLSHEDSNRVVKESDDLTSLLIGFFGLALSAIAKR